MCRLHPKSKVQYGSEGGVGNLEGSCTADRAYQSLGSVAEVTSNLKDCCTSDRECVDFTEIEIASQCTVSLCDRIVLYISFISCALYLPKKYPLLFSQYTTCPLCALSFSSIQKTLAIAR